MKISLKMNQFYKGKRSTLLLIPIWNICLGSLSLFHFQTKSKSNKQSHQKAITRNKQPNYNKNAQNPSQDTKKFQLQASNNEIPTEKISNQRIHYRALKKLPKRNEKINKEDNLGLQRARAMKYRDVSRRGRTELLPREVGLCTSTTRQQ